MASVIPLPPGHWHPSLLYQVSPRVLSLSLRHPPRSSRSLNTTTRTCYRRRRFCVARLQHPTPPTLVDPPFTHGDGSSKREETGLGSKTHTRASNTHTQRGAARCHRCVLFPAFLLFLLASVSCRTASHLRMFCAASVRSQRTVRQRRCGSPTPVLHQRRAPTCPCALRVYAAQCLYYAHAWPAFSHRS